MAITWPAKNNYATGDVLTATNMNGIGDDLNALFDNNFYAGKNKIINGDFNVNQRNFTSTTSSGVYIYDRWNTIAIDGTTTFSAQTFTPGSAPVAGYEGKNYLRIVTTGQTLASAQSRARQYIEGVRTFAGKTVIASFWAKANSGTPNINVALKQNFGTGGSAAVFGNATKQAISTSWARYSFPLTIPSISGKTIGTDDFLEISIWCSAGSDLNSYTDNLGIQTNTFEIWGVQVEAGSTATPFQTATGTIQGELAACQRYYIRNTTGANYGIVASGSAGSTTASVQTFVFPSQMRVTPTAIEYANLELGDNNNAGSVITSLSINTNLCNKTIGAVDAGTTGLTQYRYYNLRASNNTSAYLAFSAEL